MTDSQRKTANLCPPLTEWVDGYVNSGTGTIHTPTETREKSSDFIRVEPNSVYVFSHENGDFPSGDSGAWRVAGLYDSNKQFISRVGSANPSYLTITATAETAYIRLSFRTYGGSDNAMLNTGSTALPYAPYWQHSLRKLGTSTDTLTTLPADLYADGNNATVGLVGNMSQSGTPTPTTPIQPQECGERTGNLFDISRFSYIGDGAYSINDTAVTMKGNTSASVYYLTGQEYEAGTYTFTFERETSVNCYYVIASDFSLSNCQIDGAYLTMSASIATKFDKQYAGYKGTEKKSLIITSDVPFYFAIAPVQTSYTISNIMLNLGSTALPYEPWGVKIPISSGGVTTPVYLGEVQSTRRIKKLVLDGTEGWFLSTAQAGRFGLSLRDYLKSNGTITSFCSHYTAIAQKSGGTAPNNSQYFYSGSDSTRYIFIVDTSCSTAADFQTYLAQQYAAGTPVCIWYVLATETTSIVNEPLRKIGDYADTVSGITIPTITGKDTFDVQATLKPSEVELTYTGWHDASAKEWDGSEWQ